MSAQPKSRLEYIDWMRGIACLLMFQTHCYDSWLGGEARDTEFFHWSKLLGTFPAPLFLFLAGISFALATDKLRAKGIPPSQIARTTVLRGAEIFSLGLLFRVQEFALGYPWAPWTDLLRVDVLNMIGISMVLMGLLCRMSQTRVSSVVLSAAAALAFAMLTPPLWTTWRPRMLPWWLESYVNGVHTFPDPQPWLFPIFPWTAFAFAGLTIGFLLFSESARAAEARAVTLIGIGGAGLAAMAYGIDAYAPQIYAVYDFWHTSPNFFLIRVGLLLIILFGCFTWCRWGFGTRGFSPMIQIGQTSLLVYWVHIEFVYGRFSILPKRGMGLVGATLGLAIIFTSMVGLSLGKQWAAKKWRERRAI
ncbi:MAG: DUF1624 domain-containing protein [Acidobacteria bacterium]|nr:DUF1624 domain-containing protein [Acidobacteriota bacterium]